MLNKYNLKLLESLNDETIDSKIIKNDIIFYSEIDKNSALILNINFKNYLKRKNLKIFFILSYFYFDIKNFLKLLNKKNYGELFMKNKKIVDCTKERLGIGEIINTKYDDKKGLIYVIRFESGVIRELQPSDIDYL